MHDGAIAQVNIKILEKEYQIACPASERAALLDSAEMLNAKMREIRDSGRVVGLDRIAVMAALNMANELLRSRGRGEVPRERGQAAPPGHARARRGRAAVRPAAGTLSLADSRAKQRHLRHIFSATPPYNWSRSLLRCSKAVDRSLDP